MRAGNEYELKGRESRPPSRYRSLHYLLPAPPPCYFPPALMIVDFTQPRTVPQLASVLGCPEESLEWLLRNDRTALYFEHSIPKRNGRGHRVVFEPVGGLGAFQKSFAKRFEHFAAERVYSDYPHPSAHGFNRGSSAKTNASPHCGAKQLLRLDLRSFFSSISRQQVEAVFSECGIRPEVVPYLSALVTISDFLPEGLPTSPLISNLVALPMDRKLYYLAQERGLTYTRYADDISFSSRDKVACMPELRELAQVIESYGFELAEEKVRFSVPGQAHFVTGLSVQLDDRPTVPKRLKRELRKDLYFSEKFGIADHAAKSGYRSAKKAVNIIDGKMNYVLGVEPAVWWPSVSRWRSLMSEQGIHPDYHRVVRQRPSFVKAFIDESVVEVFGQKYFSLAMVEFAPTVGLSKHEADALHADLDSVRSRLRTLALDYYIDPFSAGGSAHLPVGGLHHNEDHIGLQEKVVEYLAKLPVQIFVAYCKFDQESGYAETYGRALKSLLRGRLRSRKNDILDLVFEENPRVRSACLDEALSEIRLQDTEAGAVVNSCVASKESEPLLAVADYSLGVFFSQRKDDSLGSVYVNRFERLRHRYRYITNLSSGLRFNRRNPIGRFSDGFK